jgi:dolichol-phosphate mannosyltransferase
MTSPQNQPAPGRQPVSLFSIVMPAYNEEDVIEATLTDLCDYLDATDFAYEVVVTNDGSKDRTGEILARIAAERPQVRPVLNPGPGGYGYAIRKGLEVYEGGAAVVVTADGADSPKDVAAYFGKINEGYDCAFGARFGKDSTVTGYPPIKRVINRMANQLLAWIVGVPYKDFTNGFKCYRREVIEDMQPLITGQFNITIEMSLKATLAGWSYAVVPNDWRQRDAGESSFKVMKLLKPYAATMIYCLTRRYLLSVRR